MNITKIDGIAVIKSDGLVLTDIQSALDLIAEVNYRADSNKIVVFKENFKEDFFDLSTRKLGEILQKFVTYDVRLAIVGDFTKYTSKALKDFIYESNKGRHIYFADTQQSAIEKLRLTI